MGAFTGPSPSGSSGEKTDPAEILPQSERKAAMSTLNRLEVKWSLGAFILATVAGIAHTGLLRRREQGHQGGEEQHRRRPRRQAARRAHPDPVRHRIRGPVEAQAHTRGLRPLPDRFRFHGLRRAHRVRLHPYRRLAHAASLADQQVRNHQFEDDRPGGRCAARGAGNARRLHALHPSRRRARPPGSRRRPASATPRRRRRGRRSRSRPNSPLLHRPGGPDRRAQPAAGSIRSAERSNRRASVRRRTSERAVGSSPSARSTSTSVTMPMTVE